MRIFARSIKLGLLTSATAIILASCGNSEIESSPKDNATATAANTLPPIADYLACLPQETALLAAHRGSARNSKYPENSMSALNALLKKGYLLPHGKRLKNSYLWTQRVILAQIFLSN